MKPAVFPSAFHPSLGGIEELSLGATISETLDSPQMFEDMRWVGLRRAQEHGWCNVMGRYDPLPEAHHSDAKTKRAPASQIS